MNKIIKKWKACNNEWCMTLDEDCHKCYRIYIQKKDALGNLFYSQVLCLRPHDQDSKIDEPLAARALAEMAHEKVGAKGDGEE